MIERATNRGISRRRRVGVTRRYPSNCETRFVKEVGLDMPTELANRFERHVRSRTKQGRLLVALELQDSL
jgi:hypothetical protein